MTDVDRIDWLVKKVEALEVENASLRVRVNTLSNNDQEIVVAMAEMADLIKTVAVGAGVIAPDEIGKSTVDKLRREMAEEQCAR